MKRKKSTFEKWFSFSRHQRRFGASKVVENMHGRDLLTLKNTIVDEADLQYTHGSEVSIEAHIENLKKEFVGQSELCHYHASLLVLIRREINVKSNFTHLEDLWKKFDVELITDYKYVDDDLEFLLNHIKILCGNNQEVCDFVIKFIAHLFYKPEEKIGKMILFCSKEGTGKSMFYNLLKSMIGTRFYSIGDVKKNLLGNFNSALLNSYVINLEEVDYFSSKDGADILKNLITLLVKLVICR